jgi:hypothetical protein
MPTATAAEPPWPTPDDNEVDEWRRFEGLHNHMSACIVSGLLESEGVPTIIESSGIFPDTESSFIWVPKQLVHRARWVMSFAQPTENELTFLATGKLQSPADSLPRRTRRLAICGIIVVMTLLLATVAGTTCFYVGNWCGI